VKSIYPSKGFLTAAKVALDNHEMFEVAILGGWRGKTLAKEIKSWPSTAADARATDGKSKPPSIVTSILMIRLFTIHWMALSAQYEMLSIVNGNEVLITYVPR
jgi:hypothetical protein